MNINETKWKIRLFDFFHISREILKRSFTILILLILTLVLVSIVVNIIYSNFTTSAYLSIIDDYLRIVLRSWSAAILIIGFVLLMRHREAIDYFIKERMTGIGLDGVKGSVIETSASEEDITSKSIVEAREDDMEKVELAGQEETSDEISIEENIAKPLPNTINKDVYLRALDRYKIEKIVQEKLLEEHDDTYSPNVKLSTRDGKSQILDGVFETYSGEKKAVEIKYIGSSKNPLGLKYQMTRLKEKLIDFGIKKLVLIIIADNLSVEEARAIRVNIKAKLSVFFYNIDKSGNLNIVSITKNEKKSLF